MAVKAREIPSDPRRTINLAAIFAAGLALAFGITFWVVGGRYTLDGWIVGINTLLGFLQLPVRVPRAESWWVLLFIPLALAYSWVEFGARPGRMGKPSWRVWMVGAIVWLIVIGTDVGTTYIGVANPGPRPWPISQWLADHPWAGGTWAIVLTFWPELLILYALRLLR